MRACSAPLAGQAPEGKVYAASSDSFCLTDPLCKDFDGQENPALSMFQSRFWLNFGHTLASHAAIIMSTGLLMNISLGM